MHQSAVREVSSSNSLRDAKDLDIVIPKELVVAASTLVAQQEGIEKRKFQAHLLDETRLAMSMVFGWDYSQVRK